MSGYRYYDCTEYPTVIQANSPAKARSNKLAYPSITTVLKLCLPMAPFVSSRMDLRLLSIARQNQHLTDEQIYDLRWGTCLHPQTGEEIGSGEFGTAVHERIEDHLNAWIEGGEIERTHIYDPWAYGAIQWMQKIGAEPISTELSVTCHECKTAGTIDNVSRLKNGRVIIADYKNRKLGPDLKAKTYDKDVCQLAIGAQIIKEQMDLDYDPTIYSVCIDVETGKCVPKKWTHDKQMWGLRNFYACASLFHTYHS